MDRVFRPKQQHPPSGDTTIQNEGRTTNIQVGLNEGTEPQNREKRGNKTVKRNRRYPNKERKYPINNSESGQTNDNTERLPPKIKKHRKPREGYSLCVSNIERTVRIRDLKGALTEKGIRPNFIVWKGYRGLCYLHYNTQKKEAENHDSIAIDDIIEKVRSLNVNPTEGKSFNVKVMDPITRIETVNVTSV